MTASDYPPFSPAAVSLRSEGRASDDSELLDSLLDDVLTAMREPLTLKDARDARDMLTRVHVARKKAEVLASRRPAQGADEPGTAMLGGCTCYGKAPTVPVYRSRETHLDDCPAKATSYPVGVCITNATREQQDWIEGARVLREQTHVEAERWRAKGTPERSITTFGGAMKAQAAKLEHFVIHGRVRDE